MLPALEKKLAKKHYFATAQGPTIADIQYYFEISTVLILLGSVELAADKYPQLHKWFYEEMRQKYPGLVELD